MKNKEQFDLIENLYRKKEINLEKYEDMRWDLFKQRLCKDEKEFYKKYNL